MLRQITINAHFFYQTSIAIVYELLFFFIRNSHAFYLSCRQPADSIWIDIRGLVEHGMHIQLPFLHIRCPKPETPALIR